MGDPCSPTANCRMQRLASQRPPHPTAPAPSALLPAPPDLLLQLQVGLMGLKGWVLLVQVLMRLVHLMRCPTLPLLLLLPPHPWRGWNAMLGQLTLVLPVLPNGFPKSPISAR